MTNYSPEDRASRAIAEAIARNGGENVAFYVAEQIRQAEQAAYERAAQVAERFFCSQCDLGGPDHENTGPGRVAILIRALAQQPEEVG